MTSANKITMPDERPYRVVTDTEEACLAVARIRPGSVIGLDTETYWDPAANHSRVSLVQIAPPEDDILVIDLMSVDLGVVRPVLESPEVTMVAHNARFDESMLIGAGVRPVALVDTLRLARRALRLPSYSLAGVSAHLFGVELDKRFQKSNWRRRPLTRAQLEYAATDAYVTLRVYEELLKILAGRGEAEAALRFSTLTPQSAEPKAPRRRRAAPQPLPRPLTDEEKLLLKRLKKWRLEKSFEARVPAYMICPDRTLEHLVMERPAKIEELNSIHGLGESRVARYGEDLLKALREASGK